MSLLPWLDDETFIGIVEEVLTTGFEAMKKADEKMGANIIDPFLMLFEMGSFNLDSASWATNERTRQAQKTLTNKIGWFHQRTLGSIDGWTDLGTSEMIDLVNHDKRIIAEIKNKYNTVKQSDLIGLYDDMHGMVMHKTQKYRGYTAYYVEIIPKKAVRHDQPFTPPDRKTGEKAAVNKLIRKIDGASFYALASGHEYALSQLYEALPKAIRMVLKKTKKDMPELDFSLLHACFSSAYGEN